MQHKKHRKWRININMEKCEVCIFAKKDLDQHQKELVVNNYSFKYNPTPVMYADTTRWRL